MLDNEVQITPRCALARAELHSACEHFGGEGWVAATQSAAATAPAEVTVWSPSGSVVASGFMITIDARCLEGSWLRADPPSLVSRLRGILSTAVFCS